MACEATPCNNCNGVRNYRKGENNDIDDRRGIKMTGDSRKRAL